MMSVLSVVSQTHLVAIAPRWLAEEFAESLELQVLPLPLKQNSRTCYLSRHEAAGRDKGHQWMGRTISLNLQTLTECRIGQT